MGVLVAYVAPAAGVSFLSMMMSILYMKFATDALLIAPVAMALIFALSRVWDGISDPIVGYLSDNTRSRLGRRRSWMLASSVPVLVFSIMLWGPPRALEGTALLVWVGVAVLGFYTAYTVFGVPHMALGAELTHDTQERNRVFGARQLSWTLGTLLAATLGVAILANPDDARTSAFRMGLIGGLASSLVILYAVARMPRERAEYMGRGAKSPVKAVRDVWQNPHARLLLFVFMIETFGAGGVATLFPYVTQYVLERPEFLAVITGTFGVLQIASIPLWVWLARYYERRNLWLFAMCMAFVGYVCVVFIREGTYFPFMCLAVLTGLNGACGATLGQAIKADVIDYDEYLTGERKEGSYFAAWAFVSKCAGASMVVFVGFGLQWSGYVPNVEQTALTKGVMLFLMGGLPAIAYAIGAIAFSRFKLNQAEHARIRRELDLRARATKS